MKQSKAKSCKEERARCLRAANKEAKRLGMKNSATPNPRREDVPEPLVSRHVFDEVETKEGVAFSSMAGAKKFAERIYGDYGKVTVRLYGGYDSHGGLLRTTVFEILQDGGPVGLISRLDYYAHIEDQKPLKTEFIVGG